MNKTAIKNFAVWARVTLINAVTQMAFEYDVTEKGKNDAAQESVNGRTLTMTEKSQRAQLISNIRMNGFAQTMEEAAYTWFNRFIALRFMEVNNYLPSHTRIFSDESGAFKPEVLSDAVNLDIDGLDKELVLELLENQENERLYKYIIITQCNALNEGLPEMFEQIGGWTELLFPRNLLREDSVLAHMVSDIPEEDWKDQVQIIGWLYQYYNTEPKDKVFADLKKNIKISAEAIPAATQLFTPDWIVRYMVENSLGRLWTEGHGKPDSADWKYYLEEAEQEDSVKAELEKLRAEYKDMKPEQIKFLDPCMGSGHILVYAFDVLMDIYTACGWSERDAAKSILRHNLYGLDIDRRAYQLAYFAVMMKARQYNRRILSPENQPNLANFADVMGVEREMLSGSIRRFAEQFEFADTYGSLMTVTAPDDIDAAVSDFSPTFGLTLRQLDMMMKIYNILGQKYDVVCTNPPYMGGSGMNAKLSEFVKKYFPDSKSDLFACFIEKCGQLAKPSGFYAMITQPSFLFLSSFEKLRSKIVIDNTISSLVHMGRGIFGIDFGSTAFVINKSKISDYLGCYFRLHERIFQYIDPDDIAKLYLMSKGDKTVKYDFSTYDTKNESLEQEELSGKSLQLYYEAKQENFSKIPGMPVAYWVTENFVRAFEKDNLNNHVKAVKGLDTCDNDTFTRHWNEVDINTISFDKIDSSDTYTHKWYPYCKGGGYSKWYGFMNIVVNWENDGQVLRNIRDDKGRIKSRPQNIRYYFKEGLTWSTITSYKLSLRYMNHCIFGGGGSAMFCNERLYYYLGFVNSCVTEYALSLLNPTLNFLVGDILSLPIVENKNLNDTIETIVKENIELSKKDWDSFETSWDFEGHPLI